MRLVAATLIALSIALLLPGQAAAYCRSTTCRGMGCKLDADECPSIETGQPVFWRTACVSYSLNKNLSQNLPAEETRKAVARAFQAWSEVDCGGGALSSLTFSPQQDVACEDVTYVKGAPNVNVVVFRDDDWVYRDTDNTLAKTTLTFDSATGEIFDADIEVNTSANKVTVGSEGATYDLQSILTHEVGHLLGLSHSRVGVATMFAAYQPSTLDLRSLDPDDVAGACAVYPPGRAAICDSTPSGGLATCASTPKGGCNASHAPPIVTITTMTVCLTWRRRLWASKRSRSR